MVTHKQKIITGWAGAVLALGGAFLISFDVSDKIDAQFVTEAEATVEHDIILLAGEEAQQTQAGFNAYTLQAIMEQEIEILVLQIEVEKDEETANLLRKKLASKQAFILRLQEEERKQLLKGALL